MIKQTNCVCVFFFYESLVYSVEYLITEILESFSSNNKALKNIEQSSQRSCIHRRVHTFE